METITFYSYKGGVGRTLALSHFAYYLYYMGFKVCLLDFDLEAPGLPYKFLKDNETFDIKTGLVDYIDSFVKNKSIPSSLTDFSVEIPMSRKSNGGIRLIPAGNTLSTDYWKKISSINWYSLFYSEDSGGNIEGIPFFLELKERIEKELNPDFLLIDSRSGITEMGGICTSLLPDTVVFFIINNRENLEGARQIFQGLKKVTRFADQKSINVIFSLSRIPLSSTSEEEEKEKRILDNIVNIINKPAENLEDLLNTDDICILHAEKNLGFSETLLIKSDGTSSEVPLYHDYIKLFNKILPPSAPSAPLVFISFSGQDRDAALQLTSALRKDGINVWLDEKQIKAGDDFTKKITEAIYNSTVFIPLISNESRIIYKPDNAIPYHSREWEFAYDLSKSEQTKKYIFPVVIDASKWTYDNFKDYFHLHIPGGIRGGGDYAKLRDALLELQKK